jgi:hypothetical protein
MTHYSAALLAFLIMGHFIADVVLQPEWLAKQKNPHSGPAAAYDPRIHGPMYKTWPYYMAGHASVHACMVMFLTGCPELSIAEFIAHYVIDSVKSWRRWSIHTDQALHFLCKVAYIVYLGMFY